MLLSSFSVLLPVLFVMGLGYWAGRAKKFDADQEKGQRTGEGAKTLAAHLMQLG